MEGKWEQQFFPSLGGSRAAHLLLLKARWHRSSVWLLVLNNNYSISRNQTVVGQKGAAPGWSRLINPVGKLQTAKAAEASQLFFNIQNNSPLSPGDFGSLCNWCLCISRSLCSTFLRRQATAEKHQNNTPRHSVCSLTAIWCNKCWSQFTKHLCQFATRSGLVLRHFCCLKTTTTKKKPTASNHKLISCFTSFRYAVTLPAICWAAAPHFCSDVQRTIFIIKEKLSRALTGKPTGASRWWSIPKCIMNCIYRSCLVI